MYRLIFFILIALFTCAPTNNLAIITAYCSCPICCGKWSQAGKTANGQIPIEGVTCAASRRIPFGTKIMIDGVGIRTVQDRLPKRYDEKIDIYFSNHIDAVRFGIKHAKVKISP